VALEVGQCPGEELLAANIAAAVEEVAAVVQALAAVAAAAQVVRVVVLAWVEKAEIGQRWTLDDTAPQAVEDSDRHQ
jgi:hypothetical protein